MWEKRLSHHDGYQEIRRCYITDQSKESIACRKGSMQVIDPLLALNPMHKLPEVKTKGAHGPAKSTDILQIFL